MALAIVFIFLIPQKSATQIRFFISYQLEIVILWSDSDMLAHINNVQYYRVFEHITIYYLADLHDLVIRLLVAIT